MTHETELKLELTAEDAAIIEMSPLLPGKPMEIKQRSIYFDTPGRALAKEGISLRIREAKGVRTQTVKVDGGHAAGLFVRPEWETKVDSDTPVLDDTTPIRALLGKKIRDVTPVFEVRLDRHLWTVVDGANVIEAVLDRGEVLVGDRRAPLCELELELKAGEPWAIFCLARRIDAIVPVRIGVLSKADRGHRLLEAAATAYKAESLSLDKAITVEAAFQKIAADCLRQFRLNESFIGPQNPAALHQARVALRRLRSATSIFKPILDDEDFPLICDGVRWLAGELGKARNLDVLAARTTTRELRHRLEAARINAYGEVAEQLASARARALMLNLVQWVSGGRWLSNVETQALRTQSARDFAPGVLDRLRRKIKKAKNLLDLDDDGRHLVRKGAKRLRYASEFFESLFEDKRERRRYRRFVAVLENFQGELGTLNDLATAAIVFGELGLDHRIDAQLMVSTADRPDRLQSAADAYDELVDAKRFWI